VAILILASYAQWGAAGRAVFGWQLFGEPWIRWFAEAAKWLAVLLTFISGWLYLWKNRVLYLHDM
jgi:uncharacterized protein (UPF0548 family)